MIIEPLFIALKSKYYWQFADGTKTQELRKYGPNWNIGVCTVGRSVVIARGYGRQDRLKGVITGFERILGFDCDPRQQIAIEEVYGSLSVVIARITIGDLQPYTVEQQLADKSKKELNSL